MGPGLVIIWIFCLAALTTGAPQDRRNGYQNLRPKNSQQAQVSRQSSPYSNDESDSYSYEGDDDSYKVDVKAPKAAQAKTRAGVKATTANENDDGKPEDGGNISNEDYGSFGSPQQGLPQVYTQGQSGDFFGAQGGGPSPGGPQFVPNGGFLQQGQIPNQNQLQQFPGQIGGFQQINPIGGGQLNGQRFSQIPPGSGAGLVNLSGGQFTGPSSARFPITSNAGGRTTLSDPRQFTAQGQAGGEGQFVPSGGAEGFNEDGDQDGLVSTLSAGQGGAGLTSNGGSPGSVLVNNGARLSSQNPIPGQFVRAQNPGGLVVQGQQLGASPFFNGPQSGAGPLIYQQQQQQQQPGLTDEQLQNIYQQQILPRGPQGLQGLQGPQIGFPQQFDPRFQNQNTSSPLLQNSPGRFINPQGQLLTQFPGQGFNQIQGGGGGGGGFPGNPGGAGFNPQFLQQQQQFNGQGAIGLGPQFSQQGQQFPGQGAFNPQFSQQQPGQFSQQLSPGQFNGNPQQFGNIQSLLAQGGGQQLQGGQFLQGQQFNPQNFQQGNGGFPSGGVPFGFNPYSGSGFEGGPFPGQFSQAQSGFPQGQQIQSQNPQVIEDGQQGTVSSGGSPSSSQKSEVESTPKKLKQSKN